MLHKINLPACTQHLGWVVQLQGDLLHALCDPAVTAIDVTADWVKARRADIDASWVERFCAWSKEKKSVLDRMKAIGGLSNDDKQALVVHYDRNLRYPEAFGAAVPPPPAIKPLPDGLSEHAVVAYRNFFELFYAPIFYRDKGYPIDAPDLNHEPFTKDYYLSACWAANPKLKVCPLCDGSMDGAELDHWLAKKHLPELNCHPQNLVEICGACNSRTNKGEKMTMGTDAIDPFGGWFHPHLRTAHGCFEIEKLGEGVRLVSDDGDTQLKLDNLNRLINLGARWTREWATLIDRIQSKIRHRARRGRRVSEADLLKMIDLWRGDAESEVGLKPNALLEVSVLSSALVEESDSRAELIAYATEQPARS